MFSALLSLSCLASKADIVTVPLPNGLSVTVMTGAEVAPLQDLKNNPAATNVTMPDDASVYVPLGFTFPYFGQNFTQSWMFSNGAVNFSGTSRTNFCCSGINLTQLQDPSYNYTVVPLWTDLIAIQGGSHYILGTPDSMTYGWYGVSEYYDASKRSSFELKINSAGLMDVRFSGALISSHVVTSGFIGDITKGEYYQHYHGYGFNTGPLSYSINGSTPTPTPTPSTGACGSIVCPSSTEPEPTAVETVAVAPQTVVEPVAQTTQTTTTPVAETTSQPVTATTTPTTTTATAAVTTAAPTATNPQPKVGEVQVAGSSSKPTVSLSQILSIVSQEQSRISNVEKSVVSEAVAQAQAAGAQATAAAEKTAAVAVSASMSITTVGSTSTTQAAQSSSSSSSLAVVAVNIPGTINVMQPPAQAKEEEVSTSSNIGIQTTTLDSFKPPVIETVTTSSVVVTGEPELQKPMTFSFEAIQAPPPVMYVAPMPQAEQSAVAQPVTVAIAAPPKAFEFQSTQPVAVLPIAPLPQTSLAVTEPIKVDVAKNDTRDLIMNNEEKPVIAEQTQQAQTQTVRADTKDNQAAGGVTIASIAVSPAGFNAYSFVMKDADFYAPKEIYKQQTVIDNVRVLRQLSSDRLHQQMVDQQYKGN